MKIKGKATYIELGTGFWGIVTADGQQFQPINMPEQLKYEGQQVECEAQHADVMTMNMWGQTVEIISFKTVAPR